MGCGNTIFQDLLIKNGVNLETKGIYGKTGFICACEGCHVEIIALLIGNGVNIEAIDNSGKTGFRKLIWKRKALTELVEQKICKNLLTRKTLEEFWIEDDCSLQIINLIMKFNSDETNLIKALSVLAI